MGEAEAGAVAAAGERRHGLVVLTLAYAAALAAALGVAWWLRGRSPILATAAADTAATLVVFAFSVACDNSSVYDPYWSAAPVPIALCWAWNGGAPVLRAAPVLVLVCAWAARLTWSCLARWPGLAHEDFRYREIRRQTGSLYWPASLFGIHLFPTAWVFLGLLPLYPALARAGHRPGALDALAALVTAGAILLEATADLQLRAFLRRRRDPAEVLTGGVWAWSRHPNYLGELLFWWGLWLFGMAAAPSWWWSAAGPLAITLLFTCVSVPWMDRRMAAGHPTYTSRLSALPALVPRLRRRS